MSYIEREAVNALIEAECSPKVAAFLNHAIDNIPAADVRPVVRGHWITEEEAEAKGNYLLRDTCSVCGHCDWDNTESKYFNFCPNCGADMRPTSMSGANGEGKHENRFD